MLMTLKKAFRILFFLFIFLTTFSTLHAAEVTIFGPQQFLRTTGAPNVYMGSFTGFFTNLMPTGKLIILNGNQIGDHRIEDAISSAEIYVNGELIFSQSDFNKNVYLLEASVSLAETNFYYIELQSTPGSYLTISFIQDIPAPSANITAVPDAINVDDTSLLTWSSSLANGCSIEPGIGDVDCNGSTTVSPDETTTYTFTAAGPGGTTTAGAIITHVNSSPVANHQSVNSSEDVEAPIILTASDPDNDTLLYYIISSPSHGSLSGEAPNLTYTPETNYNGADSFTFSVNDGLVDSNTATVQINILSVNDAPIANAGSDQTLFKGDMVYLNGSQSSDIDGDPLSYQWTIISKPSLSGVSLIDPISSNPSFLADKSGSYEIALTVNDGTAESLPDTVIITADTQMINVPNVAGMSQSAAESVIVEAGLIIGSITTAYDETISEGHVISQNPASGIAIEEGSAVDLIVSLGPTPVSGNGVISGKVLDALTGSVLSGVSITLYMELDVGADKLISQYTTPQDGTYIFSNLAAGDYLIKCSLDGYIQTENRVTLDSDDSTAQEDIILSPVMDPGEVRIVLTWGASPSDLESHLTAPNTEGCRYHCFYDTREIPGANLDLDDMDSYGPETITITSSYLGAYRYYVHDFTNRNSTTSNAFSLSGAHVRVFFGSGADPMDFYVPSLAGTVWHVFDMDGDSQEITPVNIMGFQAQPGEIDFPVITSSPVTSANLGESYAYDVQAKDPDNDTLTYSLEEYPEGMIIDPLSGKITWTPGQTQGGAHYVTVKVADGRCGEDAQRFQINVTYMPVIRNFSVDPCSGFNEGGNVILTWSTERAETITINQDIGVVSANGSITIPSPAEPVVYTLTAENSSGQKQATAPQYPSGTFSVTPSVLPATGGTATLTWSFPCAVKCTIDHGIGEMATTNGSLEVDVSSVPIIYTITATNAYGVNYKNAEIKKECSDPITYLMETGPACSWSPGDPITISWTNKSGCVTHAEIDHGIGDVSSSGSMVVTPDQPTTYTLTYSGPEGTGQISVTVPSILPTLIKTFYASPSTITSGKSVYLNWATQCAETCSINQGIGAVSPNGSVTVTPSSLPITYALTITGKGETITRSVTVSPKVTATFSATPSTIKMGEAATLSWSTVNANYCAITPGIGDVALNGSLEVMPAKNTTYKLFAQGMGDYVSKYVTVQYIPPTAQLQADRESISGGESVTLSWVFSNATTCTIDQNIGEVQNGESITVTPEITTIYRMTATGPGGSASDSVTITVLHQPSIDLVQPDGIFDTANQYYSIKWADEDADSNASISLYYDMDNAGADGTLIASGIFEDPDPTGSDYDRYIWNTGSLAEGTYYVYAVVDDGYHNPVIEYSDGPITIDHSISSAFKIKADDGQSYDYFGNSVALDNGYAIVGASWDDDGGYDSGAAYIFKQEDESWIQQIKLTADDAQDSDMFGCSVSISGYYAAVGARYADTSAGSYAGAVYIFKKDGESWIQQARIATDDGVNEQIFGAAVCIRGDLLIVGAPGDSEYDQSSGAAYIYKRNGSDWIFQSKIYPSNPRYLGSFGTSVGIKGDNTVIVGASRYSAYIFEYNGSEWIEQSTLSGGGSSSNFGSSVSIDGDYAVIGDYGYDSLLYNLKDSGASFIAGFSDSIWFEDRMLEPEDIGASDKFGYSVCIKGKYIIAGATGDDDGNSNAGAAYVYKGELDDNGAITSWTVKSKLIAPDPEANDSFGSSLCLNDGYAIIGSTGDDDNGASSGSAYIYPMYLAVRGSAAPDIIEKGGSTVLSWTSVLADSCVISPDIGSVSPYGSIIISPSETTTYVITAIGADGIVSESVTVTVVDPAVLPYVEIFASPSTIGYTDSTIISWSATNSMSCTIYPDIGAVSNSGSVMVSPTEDTIYTVTANNSGGSTTASVTVNVICYKPIVIVNIDPDTIELGESAVIAWNGKYTNFCLIQPDVGQVDASGIVSVLPEDSITYVLTATGPCGESVYNIPITVNGPVSIEMTYPDGVNEYTDLSCKIKWIDKGPNVDAVISLYYDTDDSGEDGTLIISGINETPDGDENDSYAWDTGSMPEGAYYVYAVIDDGVNTPVVDYSGGPVNILHSIADGLKVSGNNPLNYAGFGYSVAMSGDYAIISDSVDSAYIFKQDGSVWVQQARLIIEDAEGPVDCEKAVAINGDFAIVGVENAHNSAGLLSGIACIFKRQGDTWIEQAQFEADDIEYFGCSVSISGDYAIIGAKRGDDNIYPYYTGAAYVFKREGTAWIEQTKLFADDGQSYDFFGCSVALSNDYAIIGAREVDNDGLSTSGAAYIFKREGDTWTQQAKLTPDDLTANEYFGSYTAIDGDYAVVGSPYNDNSGYTNFGAVYIYKRDGETWAEQVKITDPEAGSSGRFGRAVGIISNRIIAGGDQRVIIYQSDGTDWLEQKEITPGTDTVVFGDSVAMSEDYALVGDYGDDDAGDASGAVYFYPLAAVDISAAPETILSGASTTLTWSSSNAESRTIEPDIGTVDPSGSITVSPAETTTYTITATGHGMTVTDQVTITVDQVYPLPTVSMTSDSTSVVIGDSCVLSWGTSDATSCVIDNGVGNVDVNGSVTITPSATTTYTITATGPGGTATASATITVAYPVPTVSLTAEPQIITSGSSSVLTWSSQYATSCTIEPNIGAVDVSGSVTVSPATTTTYTITATGTGGSATKEITVTVNPSNIIVNSPIIGSTVYDPSIMVEGSVLNQTGEFGVTVNGFTALVDGDYFVANYMFLEAGENTITIIVTDADGNTTTSTIIVNYQPPGAYIALSVDEESGVAPFETTLKIDGTFTIQSAPVIAYTGPGEVGLADTENNNEYLLTITTPGLYFLTAEVEYEGVVYEDIIAVLVMDQAVLDALLKSKYNNMKTALVDGDIDAALEYIAMDARDLYEYNFNLLSDHLSELSIILQDIELDNITDGKADYSVDIEYEGEYYNLLIRFVKDTDGIWRILFF